MKRKLSAVVLAVFLLVSMPITALADTGSSTAGAGITPDSPFYFIDRAVESIRLAITNGDLNKAELLTKYAKERLAEVQAMVDKNKVELAQKTAEDYNDTMNKAIGKVEDVVDKNDDKKGDTKTEDQKKIDDLLKKLEEVTGVQQDSLKNSVKVLAGVFVDSKSDQAKLSILTNMVRQTLHAQAVQQLIAMKKAYNSIKKTGTSQQIADASAAVTTAKDALHNVKADTKDKMEDLLNSLNINLTKDSTKADGKDNNQGQDGKETKQRTENQTREKLVNQIKQQIEMRKAEVKAKAAQKGNAQGNK